MNIFFLRHLPKKYSFVWLVPDHRKNLHKIRMLAVRAGWIGARDGWNVLPHPMNTAELCKGVMIFVDNQPAVFVVQSLLARLKIVHKGFVLLVGYWHKAHPPLWKRRWVLAVSEIMFKRVRVFLDHLGEMNLV